MFEGGIQGFWNTVRETQRDILKRVPEMPYQLQDGNVYVVSRTDWKHGTTQGHIAVVPIKRAAELITKGTHALATAEEVGELKAKEAAVRSAMEQAEIRRNTQYVKVLDEERSMA